MSGCKYLPLLSLSQQSPEIHNDLKNILLTGHCLRLTEMETPWAGDGRGLVVQRIWSKEGVLIATCTQEGVVRLDSRGREKEGKL